jgi:hypothetical protein
MKKARVCGDRTLKESVEKQGARYMTKGKLAYEELWVGFRHSDSVGLGGSFEYDGFVLVLLYVMRKVCFIGGDVSAGHC